MSVFGTSSARTNPNSFGFGTTTSPTKGSSAVVTSKESGFNFGIIAPEFQSAKIEPGNQKSELVKKNACAECNRYCDGRNEDTRNQHFSELLQDELQYIQPCMRTTVYAKILNFLHSTKKSHFNNEENATELEKNVEIVGEDQLPS